MIKKEFKDLLKGYAEFRQKYVHGDQSIMRFLSDRGQQPQVMIVACCDSRVDPALILQCDPGDLFVIRNVANIIPPFEKDEMHHGTSAALEFGIKYLHVAHLILLGHSNCGGIQSLLFKDNHPNDFISNWVSLISSPQTQTMSADEYAKYALKKSYENCLTFSWIKEKVNTKKLQIHRWFFDIKSGQIFEYNDDNKKFEILNIFSDQG